MQTLGRLPHKALLTNSSQISEGSGFQEMPPVQLLHCSSYSSTLTCLVHHYHHLLPILHLSHPSTVSSIKSSIIQVQYSKKCSISSTSPASQFLQICSSCLLQPISTQLTFTIHYILSLTLSTLGAL